VNIENNCSFYFYSLDFGSKLNVNPKGDPPSFNWFGEKTDPEFMIVKNKMESSKDS